MAEHKIAFTCPRCNVVFESAKPNRKFCSNSCAAQQERLTPERFWAKLNKTEGGCWTWPTKTRRYGMTTNQGKQIMTHRLAWTLHYGPIPQGMSVLHRCDNPPCCNPKHLFIGTQGDNMQDRDVKGRTPKGKHHWRAKLNDQQVVAIRKEHEDTPRSSRQVANTYGVSSSTIELIVKRKTWRHI